MATYLWDYIQSAEHHDITTTLAMLAIATSMFMLFIFYAFDKFGFKVPMLSEYGKNILLMFLLTGLWDPYSELFTRSQLVDNPFLAMLVIGMIPLLVEYAIAWLLAKKNIIVKF
jgi:hypothetical protein